MPIWNYGELKDTQEFVGEIVEAEIKESQFGGEQLEVSINPLDHEIGGETGFYHEWYGLVESKTSKWGEFLKRLEEMGIALKSEKDLVGQKFLWEQPTLEELDLVFDRGDDDDIDKEAARKKVVKMPKDLVDKDLKPIGARGGGNPTPKKKSAPKAEEPEGDHDFSALDERIAEEGMTMSQIEKWAKKQGIPSTALDSHMDELELEKQEDGTLTIKE